MNATSNAIADSGFGLVGDFLARAGSGRLLAGFVAGAFLYLALGWLYNVTLHPLRGFPGPKLAAASHLYEFYYDVLLGGRFMWAIQRMHEKYGPIVRINPREIHLADPHFYDSVFVSGIRKVDKDRQFTGMIGLPLSTPGSPDHETHRFRRSIVGDFFSKQSVTRRLPMIQGKIDRLCERLEDFHRRDAVLDLVLALNAMTQDIVLIFIFGTSMDYLEEPDFKEGVRELTLAVSRLSHINRFFPLLLPTLKATPPRLLRLVVPGAEGLFETQDVIRDFASKVATGADPDMARSTIFEALNDSKIPREERTVERLTQETSIIAAGGTEASARTVAIILYYLIANPHVLLKFREELRKLMPRPQDNTTWKELEQNTYVNAVIQEGLRVAYGITIRQSRTARDQALVYKDWVIPAGTPVGMSAFFLAFNPEIFPDPYEFRPQRWLDAWEKGVKLGRFLPTFSKGTRGCLGMNLGLAEVYLATAALVRRFDLELYESGYEDVIPYRDYVFGYDKNGNFNVKVKVTAVLTD